MSSATTHDHDDRTARDQNPELESKPESPSEAQPESTTPTRDDDDTDGGLHVFRDSNGMPIRIMTDEAYQLSLQNRGHR